MGNSQVYTGVAFMLVGAGLFLVFNLVAAIYGGSLFLIGIFLVIYRNAEKNIEQIKEVKKKEVKKK